ncbi:MAG TPA: cytochrome c3 family protein [Casimicrobiaceae bacterium]|nr:cytochrome c3 family protein [Casimicrobiaceae bacterium]
MAQIFSRRFTLVLRLALIAGVTAITTAAVVYRVNARGDAPHDDPIEQPVPFSHKHHVRDDGIDCRYCHVSVETSAFAGIPPLATCMTCHSQLFTDAPPLAPLVTAYRGGTALEWRRVHHLPEFAYFDHSIHVAKGVGCTTCHGAIGEMPLVRRVASLYMQWCLDCHRAPERYLRPQAQVFDIDWRPPPDQAQRGAALAKAYGLRSTRELTDCSTCHR